MTARTLLDKVWDLHVVEELGDGVQLMFVDRHVVHELSGHRGHVEMAQRGLKMRNPELSLGSMDHVVSTAPGSRGGNTPNADRIIDTFRSRGRRRHGMKVFDIDDADQGIVHVVGPEIGFTLPGLSLVCGDSHTCTHGAFGALAWGIGNTEVVAVLAAQALILDRPLSMRVHLRGRLGSAVSAKDLVLFLIGVHGANGGAGHAVEFAGEAVEALSMDGRMTLCNLAVEFGAKFGFVAPDETAFTYLEGAVRAARSRVGRPRSRRGRTPPSDPGARFDRELEIDAARLVPQVTWGTSPEHVIGIDGRVPEPDDAPDPRTARARLGGGALAYMGLEAGAPIEGTPVQHVFIGSCTNARLSDLEAAAQVVSGRRVATGVRAWVVPGSRGVKRAAGGARGLDRVFADAGFEWREPGCSLCSGDERRADPAGRALRVHVQPQLRRPPGARVAHAPGQPRDGRGRGSARPRSSDVRRIFSSFDPSENS